jgi:Cu/Ag efflux pump CusA
LGTKPPDDGSSLHHAAAGGGPQRRYQPPPRQTLSQPLAARGDPKRRRAGGISTASAATAEDILRATPEVESYSRRTGARLALSIAEPNTGDFLVKLKPDRGRATDEVIAELRHRFQAALPGIEWEFPGILGDLIGDLIWAPQPIEVKLFSTDIDFLKKKAPEVAEQLGKVRGVVDILDGLIYAGPSLSLRVRHAEAARLGFSAADVAEAVGTAMLGQTASSVLEGDRVINIRVRAEHSSIERAANLRDLPLRAPDGTVVKLSQVADLVETPGQLELRREDLRQDVAVTARLEGPRPRQRHGGDPRAAGEGPLAATGHGRVRGALPAAACCPSSRCDCSAVPGGSRSTS